MICSEEYEAGYKYNVANMILWKSFLCRKIHDTPNDIKWHYESDSIYSELIRSEKNSNTEFWKDFGTNVRSFQRFGRLESGHYNDCLENSRQFDGSLDKVLDFNYSENWPIWMFVCPLKLLIRIQLRAKFAESGQKLQFLSSLKSVLVLAAIMQAFFYFSSNKI